MVTIFMPGFYCRRCCHVVNVYFERHNRNMNVSCLELSSVVSWLLLINGRHTEKLHPSLLDGTVLTFEPLHQSLKAGAGCAFPQTIAMASWIIQLMVMMVSFLIKASHGKRDQVLYCSACRAIVDELNHSISRVDPRKTIDVGGFRVNPDGSLKNKQVPLARSETHLSELLEEVCKSMSDYALYLDPNTQQKQYKRFAPRSTGADGGFPDLKNFQFDGPEASTGLTFACETLVEELEDAIISTFSKKADGVEEQICSSLCDQGESGSHINEEL